ncbi:hypothetical protein Leryth_026239 [Lithospermum erythrorhizon]|nr:hypothetical protein Leryth_026239 [Lithospermum erythrorhizon]
MCSASFSGLDILSVRVSIVELEDLRGGVLSTFVDLACFVIVSPIFVT